MLDFNWFEDDSAIPLSRCLHNDCDYCVRYWIVANDDNRGISCVGGIDIDGVEIPPCESCLMYEIILNTSAQDIIAAIPLPVKQSAQPPTPPENHPLWGTEAISIEDEQDYMYMNALDSL